LEQMSIEDIYQRQLATRPPAGQRNAHLLGIASNAIRAGRTEEQTADEIANAWGYAPGERYEITHALRSAESKGVTPFTGGG
jgi:hypothetical protein